MLKLQLKSKRELLLLPRLRLNFQINWPKHLTNHQNNQSPIPRKKLYQMQSWNLLPRLMLLMRVVSSTFTQWLQRSQRMKPILILSQWASLENNNTREIRNRRLLRRLRGKNKKTRKSRRLLSSWPRIWQIQPKENNIFQNLIRRR
jgi:hypothetical protein